MTDEVQLIANGEPVSIPRRPMNVVVHDGDINIEAPGYVAVGPEQTVETSRSLEPEEWLAIRGHPRFLVAWRAMWDPVEPPEDLTKASLAVKHSVGLVLMLFKHRTDKVHIQYPETYLHPRQQARIISMLKAMGLGGLNDQAVSL